MGVHPFWYEQLFELTLEHSLQRLRERVFHSGEFNSVISLPKFPFPNDNRSSHSFQAIDEVLEECGEEGTRSILDIEAISDHQIAGCSCSIPNEMCEFLFGLIEPEANTVRNTLLSSKGWSELDRGECFHVIARSQIGGMIVFFWGLSFD